MQPGRLGEKQTFAPDASQLGHNDRSRHSIGAISGLCSAPLQVGSEPRSTNTSTWANDRFGLMLQKRGRPHRTALVSGLFAKKCTYQGHCLVRIVPNDIVTGIWYDRKLSIFKEA